MTMTATRTELERHCELNSDARTLQDIKARIAEAGVEYLYYQFVTLTGRVVGKVVPARHLMRNVENGVMAHPGVLADLQVDADGNMLAGSPERGECVVMPDLDSFGVLPWDHRTGFFFCRIYERPHAPGEAGGQPLAIDVRGNMRRVHTGFTERTGLELRSGCEPEVSWNVPGLSTDHRPGTPHTMYHVDHMEKLRPIYQKVMEYGAALGLDMIESNCEGPGQLELNWMFDHADRTADRLILHRQICRRVAEEAGATVSFMPKPADDRLGNGCHHNLSLWNGDQNVLVDPSVEGLHLTGTGKHALGGLLAHAAATTAIMGPTVNSYKRYCHTGQFAPLEINWGMDNKTCAVRLPANGRLELKTPDAMANPYLTHAVLIASIEDGLKNSLDPGEPRGLESARTNPFGSLPLTLKEALDLFAEDQAVARGLGPELSDLFRRLKTQEWERFCCAVTDWEVAMYDYAVC